MTWTQWRNVAGFNFGDIIFEQKFHERGGGVARITINRPGHLNALSPNTMSEIGEALDNASHDREIGVVVLTGAGDKAFSAGGDLRWEHEIGSNPGALRRLLGTMQVPDDRVMMCRKPVIAAVRGYAVGAGNHLAYFCDFTIAADNAIFGQNGPRVASLADGHLVAYLTRVIGAKRAREMWMLCRRYSAQQALEMGLINAVVPLAKLEEEVDQWCEELLALNPTSLEVLKASFNSDIDYMVGSTGRFARLIAPDFVEGPDIKEATEAFLQKRKPDFWQFRKGNR